jgi:hypothetical protein
MEWTTVIVTNVVQPSKTAFGVREDNGESVFIPPAVSKTMGLEISDIVLAKLVPNRGAADGIGKRTPVPWFAPLMARSADEVMDVAEVKDALNTFDYPVTADEADLPLVALEQAYQQGDIIKIVVMPRPHAERVIMWAADMDRV